MDRILRKAIAGTMALLLAAAVTGCSRRGKTPAPAPEQNEPSETEVVALEPAEPAVGVGRVMPAVVVKKNRTICIDPGHGFYDNGTGEASYFPEGVYEKHVTLAVSNFLNQALIDRGFDTIMTHNGTDIPEYDWDGNWIFNPNERIAFINAQEADYVVSIHVNAAGNPDACGVRIYYNDNSYKWNDWAKPAAETIKEAIDDTVEITAPTTADDPSSMADSNFAIPRETHAASSLIEVGFCTNVVDAANLVNEEWQKSVANGIAEGIERFFDNLENP
ncbi:MAG: N-acetylmuramoyl-L-alanine amidase [Clostridiales bacterium]|nr:N-acetylmuramoyl-L-alanine amidase [Clostridiales bacterium]